jgi:hypothetical protein
MQTLQSYLQALATALPSSNQTKGAREMTDQTQVTPLEARIAEVAQYEANILLYTTMLANLPTEWPAHLTQFKDAKDKHSVIGKISDLNDVELVADLWMADDCVKAIRTETLEKRKAEAILRVMQLAE